MPTQLTYIDGKWLDHDEELLHRRAELLANNKKDHVATTDDFAARIAAVAAADPLPTEAASSPEIIDTGHIPPDLVTAADGLLSLCVRGGKKVAKQLAAADVPSSDDIVKITVKKDADAMPKSNGRKKKKKRALSSSDSVDSGANKKRKKNRLQCSVEGCTNLVQSKGVCITHGAKMKRCSSEGCPNQAVKGGVCKRHGAVVERKRCMREGCPNVAVKGGICQRHGARRSVQVNIKAEVKAKSKAVSSKKESLVKRTVQVQKDVTSEAEDLKTEPAIVEIEIEKEGDDGVVLCKPVSKGKSLNKKLCSVDGCKTQAKQGGICRKHGAKGKNPKCTYPNCTKYAQRGGVCIRHGAVFVRKRCSVEGCQNGVKKRGLCRRHGAYEGDETPPK